MIKAEELMIGDWVIAPNNKPCKVVSINTVDACVIDENKSIVPLCGEVIGVLLTPETLKKMNSMYIIEMTILTLN